jgi:hypothetical protein
MERGDLVEGEMEARVPLLRAAVPEPAPHPVQAPLPGAIRKWTVHGQILGDPAAPLGFPEAEDVEVGEDRDSHDGWGARGYFRAVRITGGRQEAPARAVFSSQKSVFSIQAILTLSGSVVTTKNTRDAKLGVQQKRDSRRGCANGSFTQRVTAPHRKNSVRFRRASNFLHSFAVNHLLSPI